MRAVLLFSAVLHITAIGALAAFALRSWLNANRPKEPTVPEFVSAAGALGLAVFIVGTVLSWLGRPFGPSVVTGLAAGLLAALGFLLTLGIMPGAQAGFASPPSIHLRLSKLSLVAALAITEIVAFCLLVASAGHVAAWS